MTTRSLTGVRKPALSLAASILAAVFVAGCVSPAATGAGSESSSAPGQTGQTGQPGATTTAAPTEGFYLRAWQSQALSLQYTFSWLPAATIADGHYINGMVAIPMIYPGPLYVGLSSSPISAAGIDAIVAEARADGLLGATTDFTKGLMPGAISAHIELVVGGVTHDLEGLLPTGPSPATVTPGTSEAFEAFWTKLSSLDAWLAADLGPSASYQPTSVAVMLTKPTDAPSGMTAQIKPWPLSSTFAKFGSAAGPNRCGVVTGADLAALLPAVQAGNALTRFTDSTGASMSLNVRVLVPGEAGPCA
jgi:hypothetical protein